MRKNRYVLDSYAVLAYLQAETSGLKVKELLEAAKTGDATIYMSLINLGEVLYIVGRKLGPEIQAELLILQRHVNAQRYSFPYVLLSM